MSVKIVVVNGRPGVGKTSFEECCKIIRKSNVEVLSTVDYVKRVALFCGWDGTKTLKNRKFLSDLKDILTEWEDIPFQKVKDKADLLSEDEESYILFVDSREPAEIKRFSEELNALTLLIRREGDEEIETSNHADSEVFNYNYNLTIWNNGSIIDLRKQAKIFLNYLQGWPDYEGRE